MLVAPPLCPQGSQYQGWWTRLYNTSTLGLLEPAESYALKKQFIAFTFWFDITNFRSYLYVFFGGVEDNGIVRPKSMVGLK